MVAPFVLVNVHTTLSPPARLTFTVLSPGLKLSEPLLLKLPPVPVPIDVVPPVQTMLVSVQPAGTVSVMYLSPSCVSSKVKGVLVVGLVLVVSRLKPEVNPVGPLPTVV